MRCLCFALVVKPNANVHIRQLILRATIDPAPFNAGNRQIMFVRKIYYLGVIPDIEMLLEPLYKNIYRQVGQKLFMLRNVR